MVARVARLICSLVVSVDPTLRISHAAEHAASHELPVAIVESDHSHEDGDIPHSSHEQDGSPIPLLVQQATTTPALHAPQLVAIPISFPVAWLASELRDAVSSKRRWFSHFERRARSPTTPTPGDKLPLRI